MTRSSPTLPSQYKLTNAEWVRRLLAPSWDCHARIIRQRNYFVLEDEDTPRGPYLNGEPVDRPTTLPAGKCVVLSQFQRDAEQGSVRLKKAARVVKGS